MERKLARSAAFAVVAAALMLMIIPAALARIDSSARTSFTGGRFDLGCGYSHSLPDDPIMFPKLPGASHEHDFFGFRFTDAFSEPDNMLPHLEDDPIPTTCTEKGENGAPALNVSGYWIPAAYINGLTMRPDRIHVYYRNDGRGDVESFPRGFRIIAGNPLDPPEEQKEVVSYWCGDTGGQRYNEVPPDCEGARGLHGGIHFPTCWNGELDSLDHHSHVVYSEDYEGRRCPVTHRRHLPRIVIHIFWNASRPLGRPIRSGDTVMLASGEMYTLHADYMFAWDQERLDFLVEHCLNEHRNCKKDPPS
jgi:hypothetical protein